MRTCFVGGPCGPPNPPAHTIPVRLRPRPKPNPERIPKARPKAISIYPHVHIPPSYMKGFPETLPGKVARKTPPKPRPERNPESRLYIWKAPRNPSPKRFLIRGVFLHKFLSGCLIYPRLMQLASRNRPRKINESLNYFSFNIIQV